MCPAEELFDILPSKVKFMFKANAFDRDGIRNKPPPFFSRAWYDVVV